MTRVVDQYIFNASPLNTGFSRLWYLSKREPFVNIYNNFTQRIPLCTETISIIYTKMFFLTMLSILLFYSFNSRFLVERLPNHDAILHEILSKTDSKFNNKLTNQSWLQDYK